MASLQELQSLVGKVRQERGFTMDPVRIFVHLTEEVGEIAAQLKRTWSLNYESFSKEDLEEEMADVLVCVLALADRFEVDLETVLLEKFLHKDGQRHWKSAEVASGDVA
jgi:NTP pyrophosphatase (non-canonical NTP hydrolase)